MADLMEKFKNRLSSHNFRLTEQREDILRVFIENKHHHLNAEDVLEKVKQLNPDIGLATIYRNLELFNKLGIIHQLDLNETFKSYELNVEGEHHHHLVCVNCKRIIEFNDRVLERFENHLEQEYNFQIYEHRIKFYGLCEQCAREQDQ